MSLSLEVCQSIGSKAIGNAVLETSWYCAKCRLEWTRTHFCAAPTALVNKALDEAWEKNR